MPSTACCAAVMQPPRLYAPSNGTGCVDMVAQAATPLHLPCFHYSTSPFGKAMSDDHRVWLYLLQQRRLYGIVSSGPIS